MHPSWRPKMGDWRRRVRERAVPLMAGWNAAMAQAEAELRAEGNPYAMIREVEARAREIGQRKESGDGTRG